ncbi:hypothetical protein FACS1894199_12580 [Bacteroidia bacterium]|nr:hypothetical protein FACS1894199_12580 [Bacteroidia bacterium]
MKKLLLVICSVIVLGSCAEMNDKHESYLENGEIIYIGKADFKIFPGNERILLRYWVSDPRAKSLDISWLQGKESLEIPVPVHQPVDSFDIYIGRNDKTIAEGNHTFKLVVWDDKNHKSVVVETGANVYGQKYQDRLTNRPIVSADADGNDVTVVWTGSLSGEETGINVNYTNTSGDAITERYEPAEATTVVFPDVRLTAPMTWQTMYLPEPSAIDTFTTAPETIDVKTAVNIALGKPVTQSDFLAPYTGQMLVDGAKVASASRWVSDDSHLAHWVEIDLQGTYSIEAFKMWRDAGNATQKTPRFHLQADVGGEWVDVVIENNNIDAEYYREFGSVSTSKVRFYVPAYRDNRVRMYEIEVYQFIRY